MERIDTASQLGMVIRAERKRRGLTQAELAEWCNVGINFVSEVERGKETAEIGKILRLIQKLGLVASIESRGTWNKISRYTESEAFKQHLPQGSQHIPS